MPRSLDLSRKNTDRVSVDKEPIIYTFDRVKVVREPIAVVVTIGVLRNICLLDLVKI
jgi:hypothetical protein